MAARCSFCNNSTIMNEVEERGKIYHAKCTPAARGVDPETLIIVKKDENAERLRKETAEKMPETLGSIEIGERKGFVINHQTGEKRWVEADGVKRWAPPKN